MGKKNKIKANKISKPLPGNIKNTGPGKQTSADKLPLIPGRWEINALIFLLLLISMLVLYAGDLHLGFFAVDDPQYVVDNPWIRGMSSKNLNFILTNPYFANYSPLHLFSYMIDYIIAGPNAYAFGPAII